MAVNADKPERWKADIAQSVDMYNNWFIQFAPRAYRDSRVETVQLVKLAFLWTNNLLAIHTEVLREHPTLLPILRMATAPPLARDRLVGLAGVERHLVESMEIHGQLPPRMAYTVVSEQLQKICRVQMRAMRQGTYAFRLNVPVTQENGQGQQRQVNMPVDAVVKPRYADVEELPLLIEAKSAGDFTNPNKRRKEEATKVAQLYRQYGSQVHFILFLCGYFDSGYLGYEAAEGIDWVWEHRVDDLAMFGV